MNTNLGFIGTGNMGAAMVKGIIRAGIIPPDAIYIYDADNEKAEALKCETGVKIGDSGGEVVENCGMIILAVKPNAIRKALEECGNRFDSSKVLVSIAVGVPIKYYKSIIGSDKKVVRAMPNTPALIGEGMTLVCFDENISDEEKKKVMEIFNCIGMAEVLDEKLMSEVTALTGSSPAYVFMFIEAMADAAVLSGIPRDMAYKLAAQAVLGSAKMVLETGRHPGELKDQVCSPAGTTIEAVRYLEKNGFRAAVIEAMRQCAKRAREIGSMFE